ncbi:phosphatase PAP2 family protein [Micromonospora sp. DR5-3]|uniref:phosphatase PAP2 family protein n=1 Tax=unclassified Micromonospora TaxID=2617518 RepID=UPI0011D4DC4A|nr:MULTISPECIES: phosphatase PAP2 family protein [unclassified Micromonospora]MCW3813140.1 phosphatase PAP2 family protein [Micromonospora sp. DR5-3]TYC25882.1 phosphatase PAP2 family protein [Micromonospora sp. MP36]
MNASGAGSRTASHQRSWRSRRLDPDHSLGLRLTLAAAAAFLVLVPFTLLALLVLAAWPPLFRLDATVSDALHRYALDHPAWVRVMSVWTDVFAPNPLRAAAAVVVAWLLLRGAPRPAVIRSGAPSRGAKAELWPLALWVVTTMAVGGLLGGLLKVLVGRQRPSLLDPVARATGFAFPSGHALNATLAAGVLLLVFLPFTQGRRPLRWALWVVAVLIAVVTGLSRIALGVHWTSDVVGGWLLGLAVLAATAAAFTTWRARTGHRPARTVREGVEPELADTRPDGTPR